jgi:hypothetical protein
LLQLLERRNHFVVLKVTRCGWYWCCVGWWDVEGEKVKESERGGGESRAVIST